MIRRPPRSTLSSSSAASDVYKRQALNSSVVDDSGRPTMRLLQRPHDLRRHGVTPVRAQGRLPLTTALGVRVNLIKSLLTVHQMEYRKVVLNRDSASSSVDWTYQQSGSFEVRVAFDERRPLKERLLTHPQCASLPAFGGRSAIFEVNLSKSCIGES